jgi:hypothetical protein
MLLAPEAGAEGVWLKADTRAGVAEFADAALAASRAALRRSAASPRRHQQSPAAAVPRHRRHVLASPALPQAHEQEERRQQMLREKAAGEERQRRVASARRLWGEHFRAQLRGEAATGGRGGALRSIEREAAFIGRSIAVEKGKRRDAQLREAVGWWVGGLRTVRRWPGRRGQGD